MAIDLKTCVGIIEGGDWVSIRFITADVKRGTGGTVIDLPKCRIARNRQEDTATKATAKTVFQGAAHNKNPNHNVHFTRNMELPNRRVITIHPPLILQINKEAVL